MTRRGITDIGLVLVCTGVLLLSGAVSQADVRLPLRVASDQRIEAAPPMGASSQDVAQVGVRTALQRALPAGPDSAAEPPGWLATSGRVQSTTTTCEHRVDLYDYYGDGWTGNTLDVLVNGTVVLNHITLASGSGPQSFPFQAATGDTIQTVYHASGIYPYENYYKIYDGLGGLLAQDGVPGVQQPYGVTVTGNCAPPPAGACCYPNATCEMVAGPELCTGGTFLGYGHTCLECVCSVPCPPGGQPELEECGQDIDGGCNSPNQAFQTIALGETVCGTIWANMSNRDTDWYRVTTTESCILSWTVNAETPVTAYIFQAFPDYCSGPWVLARGSTDACHTVVLTADCRPSGEYWLWVGPTDFAPVSCARYTATLSYTPCYIAHGACCFSNGGCEVRTFQECYMLTGHWLGENVPCTECKPYYCDASGQMCDGGLEHIVRVQIGTIDNPSGCELYGDFTSLSTDLVIGGSERLTVTNGSPYWPDDCVAWIDYNHDLAFTGDEELAHRVGPGPYAFLAAPPLGSPAGPTRMRIVLAWNYSEPCGHPLAGEVEDYTVNLVEAPGACCHGDGQTCTLELPSACDGMYWGPSTTCAFNDCNNNGVDDFCDIHSGVSTDCDANGIPDECEAWYGIDCNGNGIPDRCDLLNGTSHDFNNNGILDECDIKDCNGEPWCADCNKNNVPDGCETLGHASHTYVLDDGSHDDNIGLTRGGYLVWLSRFTVADADTRLTRVRIAYGTVDNDTPVMLYVWSDPNQDGDPHDAQVLVSVPTAVVNAEQDVFNIVDIPPTDVGPVGSYFFVGVILEHAAGSFPAPLDKTTTVRASWLGGDQLGIDPNALNLMSVDIRVVDDFGFPGNWLLRPEAVGDCNNNGLPDECDLPPTCEGPDCSLDCNGNGTPDECEVDCNGNGIPDDCDLASGFSPDCNGNGIPDECDLASGFSPDCNGNSVPDECDVAYGNSPDCNRNGIPDECDIANCPAGELWCADCQPDGIPDGCQLLSRGGGQVLSYDDGSSEDSLGLTAGGEICWIHHFTADPAGTVLAIQTCFGSAAYPGSSGVSAGQAFRVYVWSDPNGDANPADAVLVSATDAVIDAGSICTDVFQTVAVNVPVVGSFFVGASTVGSSGNPAPMDSNSTLAHQAWVAFNSTPFDPNNLPANLYNLDGIGYPANWLLRAVVELGPPPNDCNENGVPDECDISSGHSADANGNGIPDECELPALCAGDGSCDGVVNFADIDYFVAAIPDNATAWAALYAARHGGATPPCQFLNNDCNGDGHVNFADIDPFVALIPSTCP